MNFRFALSIVITLLVANQASAQARLNCEAEQQRQIDNGHTVADIVTTNTSWKTDDDSVTDENGNVLIYPAPVTRLSFYGYAFYQTGLRFDGFTVTKTDENVIEVWGSYSSYGCWRWASVRM